MLKEVVKKIIKFLELVDRYCLLLLGEAQRVSHTFRGFSPFMGVVPERSVHSGCF